MHVSCIALQKRGPMKKQIDPEEFGLPPRTVIEPVSSNHYALVISRKSRIIMSDGKKLLAKIEKIRNAHPGTRVSIKTSAPVCSKTKKYLESHTIEFL